MSTFASLFSTHFESDISGKLQALSRSKHGFSKCRSVAWKLMLGVIPLKCPLLEWSSDLLVKRETYKVLLKARVVDREEESEVDEIEKDLERLYPNGIPDDFFERGEVRGLMRNVLLLWAKEHPSIGYRQGMHELLATLVYVLYEDAVGNITSSVPLGTTEAALLQPELSTTSSSSPIDTSNEKEEEIAYIERSVMHRDHIEADSYLLFSALMDHLLPLYALISPYNNSGSLKEKEREFNHTPVIEMSKRVLEKLNVIRPSLYRSLLALRIEPQMFILKWTRLLFVREFTLPQTLKIWDLFLSENIKGGRESSFIAGVEYLSITMILSLEDAITSGDYSIALSSLMNYPSCDDQTLTGILDYSLLVKHFFLWATSKNKKRVSMLPSLQDILKNKRGGSSNSNSRIDTTTSGDGGGGESGIVDDRLGSSSHLDGVGGTALPHEEKTVSKESDVIELTPNPNDGKRRKKLPHTLNKSIFSSLLSSLSFGSPPASPAVPHTTTSPSPSFNLQQLPLMNTNRDEGQSNRRGSLKDMEMKVIALDVANRLEASVHVLENEWRRIGDGYIIDAADDKGRDKNVGKCFTEMKQMVHVLRGTVDIRECTWTSPLHIEGDDMTSPPGSTSSSRPLTTTYYASEGGLLEESRNTDEVKRSNV